MGDLLKVGSQCLAEVAVLGAVSCHHTCSSGLREGSNMGRNPGDDQSHQLIRSHHHVHFHDTQKCAQGTDRLPRKRQQTAADASRAFFLPDTHQSVVS